MNEKLNTLINKFGMPTLAVAGTAIAALAGTSSAGIAALPLTIATNLLSNNLTNLTEIELINRLKNVDSTDLNHDIFRVSKSAVKLALKATIDDCIAEKDTCKKLKKKVDEICKKLEDKGIWEGVKAKDIIDYESNLSENGSKWSELFTDELKATNDIFKGVNFDKTFQSNFHLYFGEYLKKDHSAFVAYEREMQKMVLDAVNELKGENISKVIKESIAQYIKEIPTVSISSEIQEEFTKELSELKSYFQPKKIIIREIKSDKLIIEIPSNEIKEIGNNYDELKTIIDDKYYFEIKNHIYAIDELTKETFDYLTGKRANQTLIKKVIETLCEQKNANATDIWQEMSGSERMTEIMRDESIEEIRNLFRGILTTHIDNIFDLGDTLNKNKENEQCQIEYVEKTLVVVERIVNIFISYCLSKMNGHKVDSLMLLANNYIDDKIDLLRRLLDDYFLQNNDEDKILSSYFQKRNNTEKEEKLLVLARELFNLNGGRDESRIDLNLFDCYRAEIILTEFLTRFSFLANYNLISIYGIEYHNMLGNQNPLYIQRLLSSKNENGFNYEESKFEFSHCVILVNTAGEHCANLFPFLIDYNSLKPQANTNTPDFLSFFSCRKNENTTQNHYFKTLYYRNEREKSPIKFSYDENIKTYQDTQEINSSIGKTKDKNIEQYNINRLMDSLFINN